MGGKKDLARIRKSERDYKGLYFRSRPGTHALAGKIEDLLVYFEMSANQLSGIRTSIPVDLINSTDEELSKDCPGLKARRDAALSVLEKHKIFKDLEARILSTWIDLGRKQIEGFLESYGISTDEAPSIWSQKFLYCVLGQEGKVRCGREGLHSDDRVWLFKACNALGLKYEGMGRVWQHQHMEKDMHLVALHVPKDWTFDPDRRVAQLNLCGKCNEAFDISEFVEPGNVMDGQTPKCEECHDQERFLLQLNRNSVARRYR